LVESVASQTELRIAFRAFPENGEMRAAQDMLLRLLDDGMSSRLYHRVCDDKGLCYDVSANFDGYEDDGVVDFAAGVIHENVPTVTQEILALMTELAAHGPDADEIEKARCRNAWEVRSMLDSVEDLGGFYAGSMLFDRFETPQQRLARNRAVTPTDLRDLVRCIARPERLNVLVVGMLRDAEARRLNETVRNWKGWS
jgi:predicted Zn-dependent peptidase